MGADQSEAGGALPGQMTFLTKHAQLETTHCIRILGFGIALNGPVFTPFHFLQSFLYLEFLAVLRIHDIL
jgi:hypothetical protein